ncbi:hypothetical protein [Domibacillus enclensis]|uniref:Uncharacterized protein n=1 Tax=Domibacillus enclensis TaxID=1017273 RepID=A0A1N6VYK3_9BACI|nr:hypothetical protein [Domibacillus enclensis]OXS77798.1 hypothetical protein B1B05_09325 [Domibacillus enclensis]SIQ82848.1 hypothetical protein SAMN05443094_10418 [Domibacillus enclensis]
MNSFGRWIFLVAFVLITILLVNKGIELWSIGTNVDGAGIGINFLGIEINDRVSEENIPSYACGFFITSAFTLLASIIALKVKRNRAAGSTRR